MGISIVAFVLVLGVLIFVHELGHFLVARAFGVGVEKFSLGFGPRIFGKTVGLTEYRLMEETFGQRIGDLLQAGVIFVGLHYLGFGSKSFMLVAAVLAALNLFIVYNIIRQRNQLLSAPTRGVNNG